MNETSAESLIMAMNSLPMAGVTMRTACGRTMRLMMRRWLQAQRRGGLALPARHGLDAGPEDLRHVGPVVEGQREDAQHDARDLGGLREQICGRAR